MAREYEFEREITNPGAITLLQLVAAAAMPIVIMKATVTQRNSVTSTAAGCYMVRKSAAATVTAAVVATDMRKLDPGDAASVVQVGTALSGYVATVEGTDTDVLWREGDNILNGYYQEPQPELRITVPGGGIIGLKLSQALTGIYSCKIVYAEGVTG